MLAVDGTRRGIRLAIRAALGLNSLVLALSAQAQNAAPADSRVELEEVVVTGFRQSLNAALDEKRAAAGAIDAIVAEDIADFPDLNLAESIQRIPGVAIARDAGEGRQISVRGLSPEFTRVRLNGIEAMSANGGTDAAGGAIALADSTSTRLRPNSSTASRCESPPPRMWKRARSAPPSICAPADPLITRGLRSSCPDRVSTTIWRKT